MQGSPGEVLTWGRISAEGDSARLRLVHLCKFTTARGSRVQGNPLRPRRPALQVYNPRPPHPSPKTCNLSRRWDESACRCLCGVDDAHGGRGAAWTGREPFPGPSTCQDSRDRGRVLVLSLRANDSERKGEEDRAALGDPQELQREDPEGLGRELGAPTLGVYFFSTEVKQS